MVKLVTHILYIIRKEVRNKQIIFIYAFIKLVVILFTNQMATYLDDSGAVIIIIEIKIHEYDLIEPWQPALSQRIVSSGDFTNCNWTNRLYVRKLQYNL